MRRSRFFSEKVPSYLCAVKGLHGKPEARISQREAVVKGMNCVLREGRTDNMGLFLIGALAGILTCAVLMLVRCAVWYEHRHPEDDYWHRRTLPYAHEKQNRLLQAARDLVDSSTSGEEMNGKEG